MGIFRKLFDKPPTPEAFAKLAAEAMRSCGFPESRYEPETFCMRISSSEFYNLENVYQQYLSLPKNERAALLTRWFTTMRNNRIPDTFDEVRDSLLTMVRLRSESINAHRASGGKMPDFLTRPFSDDLSLTLVLDTPTSVLRITRMHLEKWGVDEEIAYATGMHNLRLKSADVWLKAVPGVYVSGWRDNFDASRAIFADLVRRAPIDGEPVIMLPNRDHLLIASSRDETAIQAMTGLSIGLYDKQNYSLSIQPLVLRDGAWVPYELTGKLQQEIRRRVLQELAGAYESQGKVLERNGEDVFYASLMVFSENGTDEVHSLATWGLGVHALLPKAESIVFMKTKETMARVEWNAAMKIIGELHEEPGMWPPRYRVSTFPSDEQFAALEAVAIA
jgi:hypothetical protein